jgi:pimeloyl-ACP methyl ester carboxylesterase
MGVEGVVTTDQGSSLYFESHGEENPKSIVFLHGGGAAGWMWREQVKAFSPDYHVLVPDLPEQGKSTHAGAYATEAAAGLVAELIRACAHGGRAHVVGLSEGAQVTVALLARRPEVVDHAVVSSAILRPLPGSGMYTRELMAASHRWFIEPLKNNDWWIRLNMRYSAGIPDEYYPDFKHSFQAATESGTANMLYSGMRFRLPDGLEKAGVPVLVAVGKHEYSQMKQSGRDLLKVLPRAQGVLVSLGAKSSLRSEHNWAMTAPDFFNAAVRAWIEDQALPAALAPLE